MSAGEALGNARREAIGRVARALGAVVSRRVSVTIVLCGEPGIGKTHVARAVLEAVPCQWVSLHATIGTSDMIRALPQSKGLPSWASALLERGETLEVKALVQMLVAILTTSAPCVLHLEDAHEADTERLELIRSLAHAVTRTRGVGLLISSRAPLNAPFVDHCLEPLTLPEVSALLEGELKGEIPRDGLEWVFERTRGNPLFALEFTRYLRRQGFLWSDGVHWHWREPPQQFMPITIESLIAQMIAHACTDNATRLVLETSALIPHSVRDASALLAALTNLDASALTRTVRALEARGLLREGLVFVHPLFREVIARDIPPDRRRAHARAALRALEADPEAAVTFADDADLDANALRGLLERAALASESAGRTERAGRWLERAVGVASGVERGRLAYRAAAHLRHTDKPAYVNLLTVTLEADPTNTQAIIDLASQYAASSRTSDVQRVLKRLPRDATTQAEWTHSLIRLRFNARDFVEVLRLWDAHPELHVDPPAPLVYQIAFARMERNDPSGADTLATTALQRSDLTLNHRARLLEARGLARRLTGDLISARTDMDEAVRLAREAHEPVNLASALHNRQVVLEMLGLLPEMVADLREAMTLYRDAGFTMKYASSLTQLGATLTQTAQYEEAELKLLEAHGLLTQFESSNFLLITETSMCELYLVWRPPHAPSLMQKYAQYALERSKTLQPRHEALALLNASRVATGTGDPKRGLELATGALEIPQLVPEVYASGSLAQAFALETLERPAQALETLERGRTGAYGLVLRLIELEVARLREDSAALDVQLEWFRARNFVTVVTETERRASRRTTTPTSAPPSSLEGGSKATVRLNVLGPITLERDAQSIPTRARKRLELLAFLLEARVAGRAEATVLEMIDALYPAEPEGDAKNTLKQQVYLLRSSLGADSIISTPHGYALGKVSSDAEDFLAGSDPNLWRGAYLGGLIESWYPSVREALTLSLHSRISLLIPTDPHLAARLCAILNEMEPYDAEILRLCLRTLEATGEARTARRVFLEGRARLLEVGEVVPERLEDFLTGLGVA
jgi:tetratricopeptide (TPR) repeat protein